MSHATILPPALDTVRTTTCAREPQPASPPSLRSISCGSPRQEPRVTLTGLWFRTSAVTAAHLAIGQADSQQSQTHWASLPWERYSSVYTATWATLQVTGITLPQIRWPNSITKQSSQA